MNPAIRHLLDAGKLMMEEKCFKVEQLFLTNYQFTRLQNEARHEVQLQELLS